MLTARQLTPELMDDPELDPAQHASALAGLQRLNRASRAAHAIAGPILHMAKTKSLALPLTLLDIACGGGDVPLSVAKILRAHQIAAHLTLSDISPTALLQAHAAAARADVPVTTAQGRAPNNLPKGPFDVVTNSLFLHHLDRPTVVATLAAMKQRTRHLLVISDLRRSRAGYAIAWATCRLLSRSPIVHHDGPVSVRAAWTQRELAAMAGEAGLVGATIRPCFPWRMLLTWSPGGAA